MNNHSHKRMCDFLEGQKFTFIETDKNGIKKYIREGIMTVEVGELGWDAFGADGRDFQGSNARYSELAMILAEYRK
ncbi:hypothetical protein [Candidatus Pristimantibacillus sp. PTI5]|uniref:hypothetical protein n=1 Tax=Candidatus Pristimantibacillus sp. PTI5 TaxID=3400422 RepID=UPI003B025A6E